MELVLQVNEAGKPSAVKLDATQNGSHGKGPDQCSLWLDCQGDRRLACSISERCETV